MEKDNLSNGMAWGALLKISLLVVFFTAIGATVVYKDWVWVMRASTLIMGFVIGVLVSVIAVLIPIDSFLNKKGQDDGK